MCGPQFCAMKITEEVREYAARREVGDDRALEVGLQDKAAEFRETGGEIYLKD
jgi:phosphomethylpyrimidine synthase